MLSNRSGQFRFHFFFYKFSIKFAAPFRPFTRSKDRRNGSSNGPNGRWNGFSEIFYKTGRTGLVSEWERGIHFMAEQAVDVVKDIVRWVVPLDRKLPQTVTRLLFNLVICMKPQWCILERHSDRDGSASIIDKCNHRSEADCWAFITFSSDIYGHLLVRSNGAITIHHPYWIANDWFEIETSLITLRCFAVCWSFNEQHSNIANDDLAGGAA